MARLPRFDHLERNIIALILDAADERKKAAKAGNDDYAAFLNVVTVALHRWEEWVAALRDEETRTVATITQQEV